MMLTDAQWDQLIDYFDHDDAHELLPDFPNLHGLVTAAAMDPEQPNILQLWQVICEPLPEEARPNAEIKALVEGMLADIRAEFTSEEISLPLPFDDQDDSTEDSRIAWCVGFIEWVAEQEWELEGDDANLRLAELMLPIQAGSTLFDDDPEFADLASNKALWQDMIAQIPDLMTDLYLLLHNKG